VKFSVNYCFFTLNGGQGQNRTAGTGVYINMDLFGNNWQNAVLQLGIWRAVRNGERQSKGHMKQQKRTSKLNSFLAKHDTSPTASDEMFLDA